MVRLWQGRCGIIKGRLTESYNRVRILSLPNMMLLTAILAVNGPLHGMLPEGVQRIFQIGQAMAMSEDANLQELRTGLQAAQQHMAIQGAPVLATASAQTFDFNTGTLTTVPALANAANPVMLASAENISPDMKAGLGQAVTALLENL